MYSAIMSRVFFLLLLAPLLSCSTVAPEPEPEPCEIQSAPWQPGTPAFREVTDAWGLTDVWGFRASVTDLDGDGWPDLITRRGKGPEDFSEQTGRKRWVLRNTGKGFVDVTETSGLFTGRLDGISGSRPAEIVISGDVDNDGDLDIFTAIEREDITDASSETAELMLNDGAGNFSLTADNSVFAGTLSVPVGAAFVDANLDGHLDIWLSNNMRVGDNSPLQDRLFLGAGDGSFTDGTATLGLESSPWNSIETLNSGEAQARGWGATACDLNNDGVPELLSPAYGRSPNHLWQGSEENGTVSYTNRSVASGFAFDHRDDWTTNLNAQCYCEDNPGAEDCDLAPSPEDYGRCQSLFSGFGGTYRWNHSSDREPWRLGGNSATTTCADLNNDGWMDLFTGEIVHGDVGETSDPAEVMFNLGEEDVRFERPGNAALGLLRGDEEDLFYDHGDMNNAVLDFDNDGLQDIYISSSDYPGTRGWLFHQREGGGFEKLDLDDYFDHTRSAGVAVADFDRDGDLDLIVGHSRNRCSNSMGADCYERPYVRAFENLVGTNNNFIQLRLEGSGTSNRQAVGARVTIERCGETLTRQVSGGHGQMGLQEDPVLHFGLGQMSEAKVTITWPDLDRTQQTMTLATDQAWLVRQGEEAQSWSP
jgi:hypothetical protein